MTHASRRAAHATPSYSRACLTPHNPSSPTEGARAAEDRISAYGFGFGYIGSVLLLLICVGIAFLVEGSAAYRINIVLAALWWLFFSSFTFRWLKPRPGPPLPEGHSGYISFSWRRGTCALRGQMGRADDKVV